MYPRDDSSGALHSTAAKYKFSQVITSIAFSFFCRWTGRVKNNVFNRLRKNVACFTHSKLTLLSVKRQVKMDKIKTGNGLLNMCCSPLSVVD